MPTTRLAVMNSTCLGLLINSGFIYFNPAQVQSLPLVLIAESLLQIKAWQRELSWREIKYSYLTVENSIR